MSNYINMTAEFEREKNKKASAITLGVAGILLLLIYLVKWPLPTVTQPVFEEVSLILNRYMHLRGINYNSNRMQAVKPAQ